MNEVKYYIRWDGKDKSGVVKGELELSSKVGETVLGHAVVHKIGTHILEACKNESKKDNKKANSKKRASKTNATKRFSKQYGERSSKKTGKS